MKQIFFTDLWRPALIRKVMLLFIIHIPIQIQAQHQANKWVFGIDSYLDFSADTLKYQRIQSNPEFLTWEGSATISDSTGNLIFYSSGQKIWDRSFTILPHGDSLEGSFTSTTSALFIPKPGNPDLYYLFTADQGGYPECFGCDYLPPNEGIRYSLVSTCKNDGLGDVISTEKNVLLYKPSTEKLAATFHANGTDVWVVSHENNSDKFVVHKVTESGITESHRVSRGTAVVNNTDNYFTQTVGQMKISADGKWLGQVIQRKNVIEIFPFDNETGEIGPLHDELWILDSYGFEFSPDGNYFYVTAREGGGLFQFKRGGINRDINSPLVRGFTQKRGLIAYTAIFFNISLAPDGSLFSNSMMKLRKPNLPGALAEIDTSVFKSLKEHPSGEDGTILGLPTFISNYFDHSPKIEYSYTCFGDSVSFRLLYPDSVASVAWDFGDIGSTQNQSPKRFPRHHYDQTGNYTVTARLTMLDGSIRLKQRKVIMKDFTLELGPGQIVCDEPYFELDASQREVVCYTWQDGSHEPKFLASKTGWHWVDVRNSGCTKRDSVYLVFETTPIVDLGEDQILCEGDTINLILPATDAGLIWNDMSTGPVKAITQPGLYWVDAFRNICMSRDSLLITGQPYPVKLLPTDTVLCDDIPLNLSVEQSGATYRWDDNKLSPIVEVVAPGIRWVDIDLNSCVLRDSINIELVTSLNSMAIDTVLCIDNPVPLGIEQPATEYYWSTQETSAFILVQFPGSYSVSLKNDCYSETVVYNVSTEDCNCDLFIPNVFTPNGDDKNAEFKPILHQRVTSYSMKIFNRWGKEIYSTIGNPWFGLDQSGAEVSSGVYYYLVEYPCDLGSSIANKSRQGWVQVIR